MTLLEFDAENYCTSVEDVRGQGDRVATALAHSVDDGTPLRIEHWADEVEFAAYAKTV